MSLSAWLTYSRDVRGLCGGLISAGSKRIAGFHERVVCGSERVGVTGGVGCAGRWVVGALEDSAWRGRGFHRLGCSVGDGRRSLLLGTGVARRRRGGNLRGASSAQTRDVPGSCARAVAGRRTWRRLLRALRALRAAAVSTAARAPSLPFHIRRPTGVTRRGTRRRLGWVEVRQLLSGRQTYNTTSTRKLSGSRGFIMRFRSVSHHYLHQQGTKISTQLRSRRMLVRHGMQSPTLWILGVVSLNR